MISAAGHFSNLPIVINGIGNDATALADRTIDLPSSISRERGVDTAPRE